MADLRSRKLRLILHGTKMAHHEEAIREAVDKIRERGNEVEVRVTWEEGDALVFARETAEAGEETTVVAGGGDGTVNEVVRGLAEAGFPEHVSLGLLPLGTANDLARCCGIEPNDVQAALDIAAGLPAVPIDVGDLEFSGGGEGRPKSEEEGESSEGEGSRGRRENEQQKQREKRVFINVASGGFGSQLTQDTPEGMKRMLGGISYLLTGLSKVVEPGAEFGRIETPDGTWEGEFDALIVGNGRQAGGGIPLCPDALLDDGKLDYLLVPAMNPGERIGKLSALVGEGWEALKGEGIQGRAPWIRVEAPAGLSFNLDGEPIHGTRFHFKVRAGALRCHLPDEAPLLRGAAEAKHRSDELPPG